MNICICSIPNNLPQFWFSRSHTIHNSVRNCVSSSTKVYLDWGMVLVWHPWKPIASIFIDFELISHAVVIQGCKNRHPKKQKKKLIQYAGDITETLFFLYFSGHTSFITKLHTLIYNAMYTLGCFIHYISCPNHILCIYKCSMDC